ncbi:MAG: hypothetical protein K8I65_03405, partial [Thermoanaerobaculia bacterium]|nr:hypothetical protein [Thermoanaerobaculia bacterium]
MHSAPRSSLFRSLALTGLALAALPAVADDRQLLRTGTGDPYVMILFDTSGSMNWSTKCTPEDMAEVYDHDFDTNGDCSSGLGTPCVPLCTHLCPDGDCPVPRDGDDPSSKFRQAKEALYTVLRSVNNVNFGFATFNQDQLRVTWKQWLYRVAPAQPIGFLTLDSGAQFPLADTDEVFGQTFNCDRSGGNDDYDKGCYPDNNDAADTNDLWEMTKVRRLSKLGDDLAQTVGYYIRDAGQVYYVRTSNPAGNPQVLGDPTLLLRTELFRCTASQCRAGERTLVGEREILYRRIGDFVKWDFGAQRDPEQGGFDAATRSSANNTCASWDPNTDTGNDEYENGNGDDADDYSLRFPT